MNAKMNEIAKMHAANGVIIIDPCNTYIDETVKIAPKARIYPNTCLEGTTEIGENTVIHMGCCLKDTVVGANCVLRYVVSDNARVADNVTIGPFVNLRPNTSIAPNCKIGDFVEVKNSNIGTGTKLPHLSYIGDADVGERVNVGCGTVFVNYDGYKKHRTTVGNDVFLGCNTNLVAPVTLHDNTFTAAGTTVTKDVMEGELAVARSRQTNISGWVARYAERNGKK